MQLIGKLKPKTTNINAMNIFMAFSVLTVFITILYCAFSTKWISDDRYNIERGLWEVCFNTSCYPYNHIVTKAYYQSQSSGPWWLKNGTLPMWLEVSRVTIILSAVTCFVALVLNVVSLLTKIIEMYTGGIFMLLTFGFFAVSVYIFEENIDFRTERCDVGIAWLLGWIAMILSFFTFFMGFCSF